MLNPTGVDATGAAPVWDVPGARNGRAESALFYLLPRRADAAAFLAGEGI